MSERIGRTDKEGESIWSMMKSMRSITLLSLVILTPLCISHITKQSHTYSSYGSAKAVDNDTTTCMSTGNNRAAWWMRSWDDPVTFHSVRLSVVPPLEYFEIHTGVYEEPVNSVSRTNNSLCARIDHVERGNSDFTVRCVNTREATSLYVELVGATRNMRLCEVDIL